MANLNSFHRSRRRRSNRCESVIHPMDSGDWASTISHWTIPGAYCGPAIARAKALLATAREIVAATRNHRHVAVLRRALTSTRGKQKPV
jgi:hypothetical protein